MAMSPYSKVQDLVDALSQPTYFAIFDFNLSSNRTVVDAQSNVLLCLARAHAQVASRLPGIYDEAPAEQPNDTQVSMLLKDAELAFAVVYAYRCNPEYVRTFGAGPNGPLWKEALDTVERIQIATARVPPNDNPPQPVPDNVGGIVTEEGPRMLTTGSDGTPNIGDF